MTNIYHQNAVSVDFCGAPEIRRISFSIVGAVFKLSTKVHEWEDALLALLFAFVIGHDTSKETEG